MEILPLSHRDSEGFDCKCPKAHQPSLILGWVRDDGGKELALIRGVQSQTWMLGDGVTEAVPVPRNEQAMIERLMSPQLRALERSAYAPVRIRTVDDEDDA